MYQVGTLGVIVERQSLSDGTAKIMVEGRKRARVKRFVFDEEYYKAEVEEVADTERLQLETLNVGLSQLDLNERTRALTRSIVSALVDYARRKPTILLYKEIEDPGAFPYIVARHLKIDVAQQQALLECLSPIARLEKTLRYLEAANKS
jgi:ATP-dependent Lon protease